MSDHGRVQYYVINIEGVPFRIDVGDFKDENIRESNFLQSIPTLLGSESLRKYLASSFES